MNKQEFEKRIGLVITIEEYLEIEPLYMSDPKNRDKDAFCKHWLRDGGLQWLFDRRQGLVNLKNSTIADLEKQLESRERWYSDISRELNEKNKRIAELESSLGKVRELVALGV